MIIGMIDSEQGTKTLNTHGTWCPEPISLLSEAIDSMAPGQQIQLLCSDPAALRDVPKYCAALGHRLLQTDQDSDMNSCFLIQIK
ncbi:sulfurtransferase TusA [Litorivicinus lipolyticus]|jgi:tRNA 2-thiouridine synthesizing protein A|uniref:Sulfurtransferase TusA n=2 Tax=Litorivicinus lipolyticus TaxID=418701 RepID=A0A5Q2QEW7_9GAMM|nr:sulfurtransferase TusA [Litorivicinus lipolyticus]